MQIRSSETIARDILQGLFQEVEDLCNPANDGLVAPWEMAACKLNAASRACNEVAATIQRRPLAHTNMHPIFKELTDRFRVCG